MAITLISIPINFESQGPYDESLLIDKILKRLNTPTDAKLDLDYQMYYFDNGLFFEYANTKNIDVDAIKKYVADSVDTAFKEQSKSLHDLTGNCFCYDLGTPFVVDTPSPNPNFI